MSDKPIIGASDQMREESLRYIERQAGEPQELERRLQEAHDMCDRYAEQLQDALRDAENAQIKADEAWNETYQAALREVEEHKSRCTVLEAEVAEWKSQFAAALAEKGKP